MRKARYRNAVSDTVYVPAAKSEKGSVESEAVRSRGKQFGISGRTGSVVVVGEEYSTIAGSWIDPTTGSETAGGNHGSIPIRATSENSASPAGNHSRPLRTFRFVMDKLSGEGCSLNLLPASRIITAREYGAYAAAGGSIFRGQIAGET